MDLSPFDLLGDSARDLACALTGKHDDAPTAEEMTARLGGSTFASLEQVHGNRAVVVRGPVNRTVKADALATDMPNLLLEIRSADCQTFLVYAPGRHVAGLIHAGWKGLLAGVIPSFFDMIWDEWHIQPEETVVCAGPSLCLACSEFSDPRRELPGIRKEFFHDRLVDLRGIAEDQLRNLGVRDDRFERHADCTKCRNETYWSYRGSDREAVQKGMTNLLVAVLHPGV